MHFLCGEAYFDSEVGFDVWLEEVVEDDCRGDQRDYGCNITGDQGS
ncbi:MAG: hypothetical protein LM590_16615 [Thermofilum sp.]|nr:hypothetical protein [Thermofilum sp.]